MNHGWRYITSDECFSSITPKCKIEKKNYSNGSLIPIISQEEDFISGYWDNYADITPHSRPIVVFGDHSRVLKYIDFDFVVGADGVKILLPHEPIDAKFLYYFLKWKKIPSLGYSRHFRLLKELKYPCPHSKVQTTVISELDKITELIEVKRSQLADLDLLAQSLFYEMFGDPITNPKGWETTLFGNLIRLKSGDALSAKNFSNGQYPVYGGNGIAGYHNRYNISGQNIIIGRVGALCGNVRLINADIFVTDNAFVVNLQQNINLRFLVRLLTLLELRKYANAAAQPVISNSSLKTITIPIPPISLQNEFSMRIEAVEEQKNCIDSSITDLQTLLASRMDYWYNDI